MFLGLNVAGAARMRTIASDCCQIVAAFRGTSWAAILFARCDRATARRVRAFIVVSVVCHFANSFVCFH